MSKRMGPGGGARATPAPSTGLAVRRLALLLHRYVGLAIAVFLVVAGTTGSILAFYVELDHALNPELFEAPAARPLDPFVLRDRLEAALRPAETLRTVVLQRRAGESVTYWVGEREVFVDPSSGRILGTRKWGDLAEGKRNLLPFIYRLHYSLGFGPTGTLFFGVAALLWTFDCFVGAYLTFPPSSQQTLARPRPEFWSCWARAWLLRMRTLGALVFTWHRASGLWAWGLLLVFAWSGVALTLHDQVYAPAMSAAFGSFDRARDRIPVPSEPRTAPKLTWTAAYARALKLMAEEAAELHFAVLDERSLSYEPERGLYAYTVESTLDLSRRLANTTVFFDGDSGERLGFDAPRRRNSATTLTTWLLSLHFGNVRAMGIPYRLVVCALGAVVATLSGTGVWLWWRRRVRRRGASRPNGSTPPAPMAKTPARRPAAS